MDPCAHGFISVLYKCFILSLENRKSKAPTVSVCISIFSDDWKWISAEIFDKVLRSLLLLGGAQSSGEEPSFALDIKKQTKAAMEVPQIFKWDLTAQRPYASLLREDLQRETVGGD